MDQKWVALVKLSSKSILMFDPKQSYQGEKLFWGNLLQTSNQWGFTPLPLGPKLGSTIESMIKLGCRAKMVAKG